VTVKDEGKVAVKVTEPAPERIWADAVVDKHTVKMRAATARKASLPMALQRSAL
jgi:hypothetical protein